MASKMLWVKPEFLAWILAGHKTIEVRAGYNNILRLQVGDLLLLNNVHRYRIHRIGRYPSIESLLTHEDPAAIAPDLTSEQLDAVLRRIYPPEKESLGMVALEIAPEDIPEADGKPGL